VIKKGYRICTNGNAKHGDRKGWSGVESVAQMCNFISELNWVQRDGGGRERVREIKN